ncbi:FYVE zinc finger-domain-containing protein [Spinellus fusiger]|nr:FYVE zinc finger-domain-containing protein [Spinellus fusiger]
MKHTPLINAASKGYMSIVEYLLEEGHANPLLKNNFGEAAYDVSAAAGESYICEMLERAGQAWWQMEHADALSPKGSYNLLSFHVTVMVVLHENQRATSLLGISRPQFSAQALSKYDTRGPWSLLDSTPCLKEDVKLPKSAAVGRREGWFWLTDWQIDYSDPRIDPTSGWQYARSFDEKGDGWTPVAPTAGYHWVRRRRWVRVMKRRMDLTAEAPPTTLGEEDYLYQAEEIVQGIKKDVVEGESVEHTVERLTREIRLYEEAQQILLAGIKTDYNQHRKHQAFTLETGYSESIDRLRTVLDSLASKLVTPVPFQQHHAELARELGFQPPDMAAPTLDTNPWSPDIVEWQEDRSLNQVDLSQTGTDGMAANPLHGTVGGSGPRPFTWESDMEAKECRRCTRRFGFLVRRHHCRRCGLIVCDRCSQSRAYLSPHQILQDPLLPAESLQVLASQHHRVCDKCYADVGISAS